MHILKTVGEHIRHYRTLRGWTQEQLAEALDSQGTYIGRIERGEQNVQLSTLEKIAAALHINVGALFNQNAFENLQKDEWIWKVIMMLKDQEQQDQERAFRVLQEMFKP